MSEVSESVVEKVVAPPVASHRVKDAAAMQQNFFVTVNSDVTVDDLKRPEFWASAAWQMKNLARVTVMPDDESYVCELLVRDAGRQYAVMSVLNYVQLATDLKVPIDAAYEVKWRGPHAKFGVLRLADKAIVSEGHVDKQAAQAWLTEHLKAFAR